MHTMRGAPPPVARQVIPAPAKFAQKALASVTPASAQSEASQLRKQYIMALMFSNGAHTCG